MNTTERDERREQIEQHPMFKPTQARWLAVCLAAGRTRAQAKQAAYSYTFNWIGRLIDSQDFDSRRVGPPAVEVTR